MLSDEDRIRQVIASWHAATKAGDIDTVLGLMTDDVRFLVPGREPMRKDEFAALSRVPPGSLHPQVHSTWDIQEVQVSGDLAFAWTHLAVAVLCEVIRRGHTGRFWNFQDLLARLRESYNNPQSETEAEILESIAHADLVVLDDLGSENTTDWVRDRLYLIVNRRYESEKPMVITTNCSESELDQRIGQRTASRFYEMCGLPFPNFPDSDWRRAQMR